MHNGGSMASKSSRRAKVPESTYDAVQFDRRRVAGSDWFARYEQHRAIAGTWASLIAEDVITGKRHPRVSLATLCYAAHSHDAEMAYALWALTRSRS